MIVGGAANDSSACCQGYLWLSWEPKRFVSVVWIEKAPSPRRISTHGWPHTLAYAQTLCDYLSIGRVANKNIRATVVTQTWLPVVVARSFARSMVLSTMSEVRGVPQSTTTTTSATINSKSGLSFHFLSEHCKDLLGIHRPSFVPFLTVLFLFSCFTKGQPFRHTIMILQPPFSSNLFSSIHFQ